MKKFLLCLFIVATYSCSAQSNDESTIRQLLHEQTQAWNQGNIERFMKTLLGQ